MTRLLYKQIVGDSGFKHVDANPPGTKWITIHPGGSGEGQPVLINEKTGQVVGGAGGALNGKYYASTQTIPEEKKKYIEIPSHVMITVRRPNGTIEKVRHPNFTTMNQTQFKAMQEATRKAGRGEVLAYENMTKKVEAPQMSESERERERYEKERNAIERMSAMGERNEVKRGRNPREPDHKSDY